MQNHSQQFHLLSYRRFKTNYAFRLYKLNALVMWQHLEMIKHSLCTIPPRKVQDVPKVKGVMVDLQGFEQCSS